MSQQQERRRQTNAERFRDAIARRGRACFAWVWAHIPWFLTMEVVFLLATAFAIVAATLAPTFSLPLLQIPWILWLVIAVANLLSVTLLAWSRRIYRAQYGGPFDAKLAPYVVRRVSQLKKRDYVPAYASKVVRNHPTALLVRHALRTAERSSLARAQVLSVAPLPVGVCVFGQPLQDKTSLAWEAMRQVLPGWTFVKWPHLMDTTHNIVKRCGKRVVLWLDDLHEYANRLESVALDDLIDQFANARVQVVVVATCRWHEDEREARAHLGYLLDHLLPIRLASKPGDRTEDPVVLQPTMDPPTVASDPSTPQTGAATPKRLQLNITARAEAYRRLMASDNTNEKGARAVLRAMENLWSAGILIYTQERVRGIAKDFGLGMKDEDLKAALRVLVKDQFIRRMPEIEKHGRVYRFLSRLWNWLLQRRPVKNADIQPVTEWYFARVVRTEETQATDPGVALLEIWNALKPVKDTAALILLGDAYLDPRRPYLRNSAAQAIQCYLTARDALDGNERPVQWAAAQIGLGNAYMVDAGRTLRNGRAASLDNALAAYTGVTAKTGLPARALYAEAWQGVANARRAMAVDAVQATNTSTAISNLKEAENAFATSIELYKETHAPFQWASAHFELANVYSVQAELEANGGNAGHCIDLLKKAESAFRLAREVYTRTSAPTDWAKTQAELGASLLALSKQMLAAHPAARRECLAVLQEAVDALRAALTTFRLFRMDENWAAVSVKLGRALQAEASVLTDNVVRQQDTLTQAVEAYQTALQYYRPESAPLEWGQTQIELARTYQQQAQVATLDFGASDPKIPPTTYLTTAKGCVEQAMDKVYKSPIEAPFDGAVIRPMMIKRRDEANALLHDLNQQLQA